MKRRSSSLPVAVYRYGLRAPVENGEMVYDQMRKAHRYQNVLVSIEKASRDAIAEVQMRHGDLAAVVADLESVYAATAEDKAARKSASLRIAEIKAQRVAIKKALREDPETTAAVAHVFTRKTELVKAARAQCDVYWGTYLLIEKAVEDASKKPEGVNFKRWDGRGRIGVQLQGGEDADAVEGVTDTRLRIISRSCGRQPKRAPKPDDRFKTLQIRIGSDGRAPVFATFPLFMDRPLPPNTRIKNAYVTMVEVSPSKTDWHVCFTIESAALAPGVIHRGMGSVALNLGWRQMDDYMRVATWADDKRRTGEIRVPEYAVGHYEKAASLRAIRDREFNAAVATLKASGSLLIAGVGHREVPDWFTDALRWCHAWKSPERLVRIVERWRDRRFVGDEALYTVLEAWRRQERHLHDWEDNARVKANRQRDQHYREEALRLVRAYTTVVIGDENYSALAVKAADDPAHQISANRFHAAPSILRAEIKSCGRKHGAEVDVVSAKGVTETCHACGGKCVWDRRREVMHVCEHCGARWDQDVNAARNMLARASGSGAPQPPSPLAALESKADGGDRGVDEMGDEGAEAAE